MSELLRSDILEIVDRLGSLADEFEGKTILLAGGRGFLGRYFCEVFAALNRTRFKRPSTLLVLDNLITAKDQGAMVDRDSNVRYLHQDITRPVILGIPIDFVIHAAGIASPAYYRAFPLETVDVAVGGNRNLLQLAVANGARYTFFSSSEIYGNPDAANVPTQEDYRGNVASMGPRACYDESKRLGETLCWIYRQYNDLRVTIVRPFNVFGPGMPENDYRVLSNFASRIKRQQPLVVYGDGRQTRTFCYITDAIVGFMNVIAKGQPGEAYNIGNPTPEVSMLDLVQTIKKILGDKVQYTLSDYPNSYPADEPLRRCPDIGKAREHLGFEPSVPLEEGLRRFLAWADATYTAN
jgi:UDP-glucuronate decarboxylase